jgi:hypothetical protein
MEILARFFASPTTTFLLHPREHTAGEFSVIPRRAAHFARRSMSARRRDRCCTRLGLSFLEVTQQCDRLSSQMNQTACQSSQYLRGSLLITTYAAALLNLKPLETRNLHTKRNCKSASLQTRYCKQEFWRTFWCRRGCKPVLHPF